MERGIAVLGYCIGNGGRIRGAWDKMIHVVPRFWINNVANVEERTTTPHVELELKTSICSSQECIFLSKQIRPKSVEGAGLDLKRRKNLTKATTSINK